MTEDARKEPDDMRRNKVDPATAADESPRPAPQKQPDPAKEDLDDDDLFNDVPV